MPDMSRAEMVRVLGDVPLFRGLTKRQLHTIAKLTEQASFEPGAAIVKQAESGFRLVFILSGTAAVIQAVDDKTPGRRISTVGPGDIVGELSLFDGWPTSATVLAETPLDALVLYRTRFKKLLQSTPQLYPRLLESLAQRLRDTNRRGSGVD